MEVKEVDLQIFSKTPYYNGSGYRTRYGLTKETSKVRTSQKFIVDIPSIGFIARGKIIDNFYFWNGEKYITYPSWSGEKLTKEIYLEFKTAIKLFGG